MDDFWQLKKKRPPNNKAKLIVWSRTQVPDSGELMIIIIIFLAKQAQHIHTASRVW